MEEFLGSELPSMWSFVLSSLQPPYIYLIMNCIIFSIVASSSLKSRTAQESKVQTTTNAWVDIQDDQLGERDGLLNFETSKQGTWYESFDVWAPDVGVEPHDGHSETEAHMMSTGADGLADFTHFSFKSDEKPLATARFSHRKSSKSDPGGNLHRVIKLNRQESLESAWKAITGECQVQGMSHLGKPETREIRCRTLPRKKSHQKVFKSETFKVQSDILSSPAAGVKNLRRDPSLGQDELNRRVEAFINKFNEEMRLQRQESLNQLHQMINRGAH